jgi:hypothetical protein
MPTPARYYALQWFFDHEEHGPNGVFGRKAPSARMRRLMAKQGEVMRVPLGQFDYQVWRLTPQGREVLEGRPKVRRRSLPRIHKAKEDASP